MCRKIKTFVFHSACKCVVLHAPDDYAKAYAQVGLGLWDAESIKDQCLYILLNIRSWKGDMASQCRAVFKRYANANN